MTVGSTSTPSVGQPHLSEVRATRLRHRLAAAWVRHAADAREHRSTVSELFGETDSANVRKRQAAEAKLGRSNDAIIEAFNALLRFDSGSYGNCDRCGMPIQAARLEAAPQGRLCVECGDTAVGWLG